MATSKTDYQASQIQLVDTTSFSKVENNSAMNANLMFVSIFICLLCLIYTLVKLKRDKDERLEARRATRGNYDYDVINLIDRCNSLTAENQKYKQRAKELLSRV
ncbi:MAG: hypothetical protein AAGE84_27620 [Cyanobacteria bacterium P01_G01_bin.39]